MKADPLADVASRLTQGDAAGALQLADTFLNAGALSRAERGAGLRLRARAHEETGNIPASIADLESALGLVPDDARAWNDLGVLLAQSEQHQRAIEAFRRATGVDPGYFRAWHNLGYSLAATQRTSEAVQAFERAVAVRSDYALGWASLGTARRNLGADEPAQQALERAIALDPKLAVAYSSLGALHRDQGRLDQAIPLFARLAQLDPKDVNACLALADTLAQRDDLELARRVYLEAEARDPHSLRALIGQRLMLPMVPESRAVIANARARFKAGLTELEVLLPQRVRATDASRTIDALQWSNFLLAYQGEDDRPLQAQYARTLAAVIAQSGHEWRPRPAARVREDSRIRVGFASSFFRDGTTGRYFEHWITDLDREHFEVTVYQLQPGVDALTERLRGRADAWRYCPRWVPSRLAKLIGADGLDVLVYPELGMDATTFVLAALRLAPLQCAAWGHPVTTGHPTIDVFFSSVAMEPADGDAHYTERLVRLPGIGTRYTCPVMPPDASRERFGLPADGALFLCPQSLFKMHPDNDALFARVLAAAPQARLVVFEGRHPALTAKFLARLDAALADVGLTRTGRVHVLAQCGHDDYLRINGVCDAMLDTLHWSGGNTSLDALACGLPVVTQPGRFMRGRQSAGMLHLMGVEDLIARDADDYVRLAARLAGDAAWRKALAARIASARGRLFDDPAPVAAFANFLRETAPAREVAAQTSS